MHVCPPQAHLAGLVLARGAVADAVRLQVQLPERHLLVLDAELPHAACGTWRCWGGGKHAQPPQTHCSGPPTRRSPTKPWLSPVLATAA